MPQFRSKPVIIEAVQYLGPEFINEKDPTQGSPLYSQVTWVEDTSRSGRYAVLVGKQGPAKLRTNDWIIREPGGEGFYPCAPDVFAAKYEAIQAKEVDLGTRKLPDGSSIPMSTGLTLFE